MAAWMANGLALPQTALCYFVFKQHLKRRTCKRKIGGEEMALSAVKIQ